MIFSVSKEERNLSGIYKITQMSKNRVYIGQTKMKFIKRFWHHRWKLRNNQHDNTFLQGAWNKSIEDDFVFEIVAIIDKNENMNEIEMNYIAEFNSFNEGFNLTEGGEGEEVLSNV